MAATLAKVESKCKYIVQRLSDTGDQLDKPGDQASAQDTRLRMINTKSRWTKSPK